MSALQLTDKHIAYLALMWTRYQRRYNITVLTEDTEHVARMLKYENARSVACRYANHPAIEPCQACGSTDGAHEPGLYGRTPCPFAVIEADAFAAAAKLPIDPVYVIKAAQCYQYQACEHGDWDTSRAKKIADEIIAEAISLLPGYDAAPWGIS